METSTQYIRRVEEENPTTNLTGYPIIIYYVSSGKNIIGYLSFDTTGMSLDENYYGLKFRYSTQLGSYPISIERITADFNPATITWNLQPARTFINSTTFVPTGGAGAYQEVDITSMVKDSNGTFFGCVLFMPSIQGSTTSQLYNTPITLEYSGKRFTRTSANGGDDTNDGATWEAPWATIDKAANTLTDGQEVLIESGTYNNEPASNNIAPVNAGAIGIKYTVWGTAGTGTADGTGTGDVKVEKNT